MTCPHVGTGTPGAATHSSTAPCVLWGRAALLCCQLCEIPGLMQCRQGKQAAPSVSLWVSLDLEQVLLTPPKIALL